MHLPNVRVFLAHTDHDTLVSRATNNRTDLVSSIHAECRCHLREDSSGSVVTSETSLAHTRAIVDDQGGDCRVG